MTTRHPSWLALLLAIAAALLLAVWATTPVAPLSAGADAGRFSAGRAMADVATIGRAPHPTGGAEHARVRAHLVARLRGLGLEVTTPAWPLTPRAAERLRTWSGQDVSRVPLTNVVGVLAGRDRTQPAVLVMAHYDTVWGSPGAADDGAGVAAILEIVRALRTDGAMPARDLIVLLTDGEELGLAGARRFFDGHPLAKRAGAVVNLETRGGGGRTAMFETGAGNAALMRLFARAVPHSLANSISVVIYKAMPNSTDYTAAKERGLSGFNFAFTGRARLYHSPAATPQAIEPAAVQDMGDQVLALVRALLAAPVLPAPSKADASFGDALGIATIVYPPAFGWALIGAAGLLVGVAATRARAGAADIGRGMLVALWALSLAAALLTAANALSIGPAHPNYYDRLAALPRLEWQAGLIGAAVLAIAAVATRPGRPLAVALGLVGIGLIAAAQSETPQFGLVALPAALLVRWLPRRPLTPTQAGIGALALLLTLATLVQALAPTAAPPLAWPALLGAAAVAIAVRPGRAPIWPPLVIAAALGGAQALAFAHFTFGAVGAGMPLTMAAFVMILLALFRPLLGLRDGAGSRLVIVLLLAAACAIALWVRLDPLSPTVPAYSLAPAKVETR